MKSFKSLLIESTLSSKNFKKAKKLILSFLSKKLQGKIFPDAGIENYSNSIETGFGLRYYIPKTAQAFRFNWSNERGDLNRLRSIDFWLSGNSNNPDFHIDFEQDTSLAQVLPMVVPILKGKVDLSKEKDIYIPPVGQSLFEEYDEDENYLVNDLLLEKVEINYGDAYDFIISLLKPGKKVPKSKVYDAGFKTAGIKLLFNIADRFDDIFSSDQKSVTFEGTGNDIRMLENEKDKFLNSINSKKARVNKGPSNEKYEPSSEIKQFEQEADRIAFEDQLDDLANLTHLVISGSSNALFVAGRGGIGKTVTVENSLKDAGMVDGENLFKVSGSATPAGMYRLLFKHRDSIILFDDSDSALDSQEGRNIIKAATDTKPRRKLTWQKRGSNVVDPTDFESDEEILDGGLIPEFFEFTGKIIFISNLKIDKLDPDGALRTRAFMISINPTDDEVIQFMKKIVNKMPINDDLQLSESKRQEVVKIIEDNQDKIRGAIDLRKLARGLNTFAAGELAGVDRKKTERLIVLYA